MRIIVAIANHGTKNDQYASRLIDEYRAMSHDVQIVVLSNIQKNWGDDVEVRVPLPSKNPWSLPFAHKELFASRLEEYDLFIYSEDDTLVTEQHIDSFMRADRVLDEDEVPGFLRSEHDDQGNTFLSTVHSFYYWDPASVKTVDGHTFAYYSNEHAACYMLTQAKLRRAIASGGFLVGPHQGRYDMLVSAATDPYTRCGFKKMICTSSIDEFILPHLPSVYVGLYGLDRDEFDLQLAAILQVDRGERPRERLLDSETKIWRRRYSKNLYEPSDDRILSSIAEDSKTVLSIGCGWGATEAAIKASGRSVVGVALDSVMAANAERRGIEVVSGSVDSVVAQLEGKKFDTVVVSNILHLFADP